MCLLSEDRDPIGILQYAPARKRGQENQQKKTSNKKNNNDIHPIGTSEVQYTRRNIMQQITSILLIIRTGTISNCWKCGHKFLPGFLNTCTAKQEICRICKKKGHFANMCRAEIPPRPAQRAQHQNNTQNRSTASTLTYSNNLQNTRRVKNINTTSPENISLAESKQSSENESVDPESTC